MAFHDTLLPMIDRIRGIPGKLGLCDITVTVRVRKWDEGQVGLGDPTDTDTPILVGQNQNPKVRRVSYKETVAGGGRYQEGSYKVGPLTPQFAGGGVAFSDIAPPVQPGTEVYYILKGNDTPPEGTVCTAAAEQGDHPLHMYLMLTPTGTLL